MIKSDDLRAAAPGKGCGCQVATFFFLAVGVPVIMMFTMGLAPCKHGSCNANGKRDLLVAAVIMVALAAAAGLAAWPLAGWWIRRQAARGKGGLRQLRFGAVALPLIAAFVLLVLLLLLS